MNCRVCSLLLFIYLYFNNGKKIEDSFYKSHYKLSFVKVWPSGDCKMCVQFHATNNWVMTLYDLIYCTLLSPLSASETPHLKQRHNIDYRIISVTAQWKP